MSDADGGDVRFGVGLGYGYGKPGNYIFEAPDGSEKLKISSDGCFFVDGRFVEQDRLIYEAFRFWLAQAVANMKRSI